MYKDILVAILEDDVFSRNWMALLLVRDWRTRLIGEFATRAEFAAYLDSDQQPFDILILDVDLIGERFKITDICNLLSTKGQNTKVLLTGKQPDPRILRQAEDELIRGYVLKSEVGYSLSWLITFVFDGYWVLTPGTQSLAFETRTIIPPNVLVVAGRKTIPGFTEHDSEVARMAFIFSVGRRDLADELQITKQWSYGLVSELYRKMGLTDIIAGETDLFSYIGESEIIKKKFQEILREMGTSKKAPDMETLAYHLLTMPEILE